MKARFFWLPLTLSVLTGCAATTQSLSSSPVFAACPVPAPAGGKNPESGAETLDNSLLRCSRQESIYGNAVWIPLFGPWYDYGANSSPGKNAFWYLFSSVAPVIGPAAQLYFGAKQCLAECLPPPESIGLSDTPEAAAALKRYFDRALDVSDSNCKTFLSRLDTGGNTLEARLWPGLVANINANRLAARKIFVCSPLGTAEIVAAINRYDALCSIDSAAESLLNAAENQNSANKTANSDDQAAFLKTQGISRQAPTAGGASVSNQDPVCAVPGEGAPRRNPNNHVNNIRRSRSVGGP